MSVSFFSPFFLSVFIIGTRHMFEQGKRSSYLLLSNFKSNRSTEAFFSFSFAHLRLRDLIAVKQTRTSVEWSDAMVWSLQSLSFSFKQIEERKGLRLSWTTLPVERIRNVVFIWCVLSATDWLADRSFSFSLFLLSLVFSVSFSRLVSTERIEFNRFDEQSTGKSIDSEWNAIPTRIK